MARVMGYRWHLREQMAAAGMFTTTDLIPKLAERSIEMHPTQVWRLVTGPPERLNLQVLAALCDIFGCTPGDLIEPYVARSTQRPASAAGQRPSRRRAAEPGRPRPAKIAPADE